MVFGSVVIVAKVVYCVIYRRRWQTKRSYVVELVLPKNFLLRALREPVGILHALASVCWTTITRAYQIWWQEIENLVLSYSPFESHFIGALRCFDTVFRRPYRYFSIALKEILPLSDRYKIFASDWLWIEVCQNVGLTKIDITMTTINKKLEIEAQFFTKYSVALKSTSHGGMHRAH